MNITITYILRSNHPKKIKTENYWSNPNHIMADETVAFVKNLKDSDLKRCNVILDIENKEIIKNRGYIENNEFVSNPSYDQIIAYLSKQYPDTVPSLVSSIHSI